MVTFNPVNAENSQSYAYKCWYNYNYEKNTMCISEEDMQRINEQYKGKLVEWKATAEKDNNSYIIDDESFTTATLSEPVTKKTRVASAQSEDYTKAKDNIDKKVGGKVNTGGDIAQVTGSLAMSGAATAVGFTSLLALPFVVSAPLCLSVGVLYMATQPNKDEARALNELKEMMLQQKDELAVSQEELEKLSNVILDKVVNANKVQEDSNETLEEKQQTYELLMAAYQEIMQRVENGETITEEDKATLREIGKSIQALGKEIKDLQESAQTSLADINDDIASSESTYDDKSEKISTSLATTDYAADFDEATKVLTGLEIASQTVNATEGAALGTMLTIMGSAPFCWWILAFAALAFTGAGLSTSAIVQQSHVLHDVNKELDVRHDTQSVISDTTNVFDESYDIYGQSLSDVEGITFEIPENLTGLEDFEIPDINTSGADGNSGSTNPFASPASSPSEGNPSDGTPNNPFASTPSTATASDDKKNPFA